MVVENDPLHEPQKACANAQKAGQADDDDGVKLAEHQNQGQEEDPQGHQNAGNLHGRQVEPAREEDGQSHRRHRCRNEPHHRRAQAGQAALDDPAGLKPDKTPCHQ